MATEKPHMYCRQCGIQLRSDKVEEHESQCEANDSQKKSSPSHGSSGKEVGNQTRDTSNSDTRPSSGTKEVKTRTVTEKDGVKEIEETVEYTSSFSEGQKQGKNKTAPSQLGSAKDSGSLEIEDMNSEESANKTKNGQDDLITGGNKSNQEKDDENVDSKPFSTSEKGESKKNEKKDIGKHPYPTKETERKESECVDLFNVITSI